MSCWDFKSTVKYCLIDEQLTPGICWTLYWLYKNVFFSSSFKSNKEWWKKHNTQVKSHKTVNNADGWSLMEEWCKCMNEHFKAAQFASTCFCLRAYSSMFPSSYGTHWTESTWVCVCVSESVHVIFSVTLWNLPAFVWFLIQINEWILVFEMLRTHATAWKM